jgi:hypothetical protein
VMFAHSTGGKERAHQEWKKLLEERGFSSWWGPIFSLGLEGWARVCGKVINILVLTI